ncbi:amidohydrolase family protein, partial [Klebsiella pneumoniae]|uniref:amidohydrolase family protein n=1 Tax=Klebsiella pneumoniae TaxID=573 RepID=UPI0013D7B7FD
ARVDAVAEAIASDMVDVQYGPNGVQWATPDLLDAIAAASAATGRRVHMHLLETRYQRAYADQHFPRGIARHLRD